MCVNLDQNFGELSFHHITELLCKTDLFQVTLFQDITPAEMLTEPALCNVIDNCLGAISNPKTSDYMYSWFECCIKSYKTEQGVHYQIFDTCFA
jgi:hypothetical protein